MSAEDDMGARIVIIALLFVLVQRLGAAQSVELLYTPAVLRDVVALKGSLRADLVHVSNAMSMVGASDERKRAYGDSLSSTTAIVIVGEDALKVAGDIPFSVPVIVVNSARPTAATGRVIRVFDPASAPPGVIAIAASNVKTVISSGREVSVKGTPVNAVVQLVIAALR